MKKQKHSYENLFMNFLETVDFRLDKIRDGVWCLQDLQGANLGGIEQEEFKNAMEILDRMDRYIEDSYVRDVLEQLEEAGYRYIKYGNWAELVEIAKPILGEDYQGELDILDAICNHADEIDLNKCCYINN